MVVGVNALAPLTASTLGSNHSPSPVAEITAPHAEEQAQLKEGANAMRAELRVAVEKEALHTDPSKLLRSEKSNTGYPGVTPDGSVFRAKLKINGKQVYLGNCKIAEEAAAAVTIKHTELHNMEPTSSVADAEAKSKKHAQLKQDAAMRAELRAGVENQAQIGRGSIALIAVYTFFYATQNQFYTYRECGLHSYI